MRSLAELQRDFAAALYAPQGHAPSFARSGQGSAADRMDVYRRAVFANYRKALCATYPVVQRIAGTSWFATAVDVYAQAHPSRQGDLNDYGDDFGTFLAAYPPAADRPYLPDLARLEWAIDEANRAADAIAVPDQVLAALAALPAERLPGVSLRLAPHCRLVGSEYPILSFWRANQSDHGSETNIAPGRVPCTLCVRRDTDGIVLERLSAGEFAWLEALLDGASLAAAIDAAYGADPGFDLGRALHAHVGNGTIVSIG